eukprot:CAMPEP_0115012566 /NCGR_PEP_ID=MMETSP0216-20121206/24822_1 /TAXON_ID=223996 /ORGANISM="Protocruzia adherens, Strain Boccale" /LENGTH=531 /DNA_ID=CAMNT_0002381665 /DNA_START=35 /DNA_END=1630 /DNA_ORIENTATION=+
MTENNYEIVDLFISCEGLINLDLLTVTDALVEVYQSTTSRANPWKLLGRTECIDNDLNPKFATSFPLEYQLDQNMKLMFKVYNMNDNNLTIRLADFIGDITMSIHEIAGAAGQSLKRPISLPKNRSKSRGVLNATIEARARSNEWLKMRFTGEDLEDVTPCFLCSLNPFFALSRVMENGVLQRVHTSNVLKGRNPAWPAFWISRTKLCNNDPQRPLVLEVFHYNTNGNHIRLGEYGFTITDITEHGLKHFSIVDSMKTKKDGSYKNSGVLNLSELEIEIRHTFIDYLKGGLDINLVCAVDFTASNGEPQLVNSLHHVRSAEDPNRFNEYQKALQAVGEILLYYDTDKLVPMYGFGARLNGSVQHCFALNGDNNAPEVYQLDGMLKTYHRSLTMASLSGPTLFGSVYHAVLRARECLEEGNLGYIVLLIITDGEIHDMRESINQIVAGSFLPLSIVIVGVGNADFGNMDTLDADDVPLVDKNGVKMQRDIVQFVPFRECNSSIQNLRKEVLEEIPGQVEDYYRMKGIKPRFA